MIALPLLFAEVGETLIQFTDTALLGRVGTAELAAVGPADAILEAAIVPAVGLVEGMQLVLARRSGEGRTAAVGETFGRVVVWVALLSLALAAAVRVATGAPFTGRLVASAEVAGAVEDFFRFGAWGIVFLSLNLAYSSLWVAVGRARVLVGATVVLVGVNLAVTATLVFGLLGLPRLGMEGAGIGFLAAELASFAVLALYTARRLDAGRPRLVRRSGSQASLRRLIRLGTPIGLQALVEALRWLAFFLILERVGQDALAASTVAYTCLALLLIPTYAFAETGYTLVSASIGRGGGDAIARVLRDVLRRSYLVTAPLVAVCAVAPELVLALFTDSSAAGDGAGVLRVAALGTLVVVAAEIKSGAVTGTGDTDAGFAIEVLTSAVLVGAAAFGGLVLGLSPALIWLSLPLASGVGLVASTLWLRSGRWKRVAL